MRDSVFPGGADEAGFTAPGAASLILLKRRGFVELALEHGASLVPVFNFGVTVAAPSNPG